MHITSINLELCFAIQLNIYQRRKARSGITYRAAMPFRCLYDPLFIRLPADAACHQRWAETTQSVKLTRSKGKKGDHMPIFTPIQHHINHVV